MNDLIKELPDMFDDYSVHPSQAVIIDRRSEVAIVTKKPDWDFHIKYRKREENFTYREVAGRLTDIKADLLRWREKTS